jgi:hypothetical protein
MGKLRQAICLATPAAAILMTQATLVEAGSEECRAKPDLSAQMGEGHWHYRIDRTTQRRCWFLSSSEARMRRANSLGRRESNSRSTAPEIEEQSRLDGRVGAAPTQVQELVVLSETPRPAELAVPEVGGDPSESLVPHKVTLIPFVRPRAGEQSVRRGINFDLVFLCGLLASGLLLAGAIVMAVDRFHRYKRTRSPVPLPLLKAKRLQNKPASSKGTNLKKAKEYLRHSNITAPPKESPLRRARLH